LANVKISALPAATTPLTGTEVLPIVQSGVTAKVSVADLTLGRAITASSVTDSALTSGRVTYAGTAGLLQDSANLTFNGTTLTANTLNLTNALGIAYGGTGQITANASFNALAPSQTGNSGKYLTTDGANTSWATNPLGTVTSVAATAGTGISVTGSPITTSGTLNIVNTAPDQTVVLTASTGISVTGTYPSFTITNTSPSLGGTVTSVAALTLGTTGTDLSSTVANGTTTPVITLNVPTASASNRGALSSTDWSTFNNKQAALVSGTNLKTVNGTTLLGSGDLGIITGTYGGTGINNGSNTITTAGNLTFAGAFTQSFTATANTAVTLPAGATAASNNLLSSATAVGIVTGTPSGTTYLRGDGTWATIASGGTVSSVALTAPSIFTVTGSPITTSGTLALTYSGTALPILNGGTSQTTAAAAFNALSPITTAGDLILGTGVNTAGRLGIGTNGQVLQSNGTTASWVTFTGGATITPTTTNTTYYLVGTSSTSGTFSTASISTTTPISYNPSTGDLVAPQIVASNGLVENSATVSASYTIATGNNAMSVGPITVASGQSVTVSSGQRWVVL